MYQRYARYLWKLANGKKGNYLVFFPSYRFLEDVYEAFEKIQEKDDFFVQDDKCVIRIEYKSKLISRDSTNVARTRKNINL